MPTNKTIREEKAFAIAGLVRGRKWNLICGEDGYYHISYDGFKLEQKMYELKGMFPNNKYKIVDVVIAQPDTLLTQLQEIEDMVEGIDWKENHICRFNDGEQDCECMEKTKAIIHSTLKEKKDNLKDN